MLPPITATASSAGQRRRAIDGNDRAAARAERQHEYEQQHAGDGVLRRRVDGRVGEMLDGAAVEPDRDAADAGGDEGECDSVRCGSCGGSFSDRASRAFGVEHLDGDAEVEEHVRRRRAPPARTPARRPSRRRAGRRGRRRRPRRRPIAADRADAHQPTPSRSGASTSMLSSTTPAARGSSRSSRSTASTAAPSASVPLRGVDEMLAEVLGREVRERAEPNRRRGSRASAPLGGGDRFDLPHQVGHQRALVHRSSSRSASTSCTRKSTADRTAVVSPAPVAKPAPSIP